MERKKTSFIRCRGYEFSVETVEKKNNDNVDGLFGIVESKVYLISAKSPNSHEHKAIYDKIPLKIQKDKITPLSANYSNYYLLINKSLRREVESNSKQYIDGIEQRVNDYYDPKNRM